jgi:hypothetical protein
MRLIVRFGQEVGTQEVGTQETVFIGCSCRGHGASADAGKRWFGCVGVRLGVVEVWCGWWGWRVGRGGEDGEEGGNTTYHTCSHRAPKLYALTILF